MWRTEEVVRHPAHDDGTRLRYKRVNDRTRVPSTAVTPPIHCVYRHQNNIWLSAIDFNSSLVTFPSEKPRIMTYGGISGLVKR